MKSQLAAMLILATFAGCNKSDDMKTKSAASAAASSDVPADVQKDFDQVVEHIKDKKLDLADAAMTRLQAAKSKLSTVWQEKINSLQVGLDDAKKG